MDINFGARERVLWPVSIVCGVIMCMIVSTCLLSRTTPLEMLDLLWCAYLLLLWHVLTRGNSKVAICGRTFIFWRCS